MAGVFPEDINDTIDEDNIGSDEDIEDVRTWWIRTWWIFLFLRAIEEESMAILMWMVDFYPRGSCMTFPWRTTIGT